MSSDRLVPFWTPIFLLLFPTFQQEQQPVFFRLFFFIRFVYLFSFITFKPRLFHFELYSQAIWSCLWAFSLSVQDVRTFTKWLDTVTSHLSDFLSQKQAVQFPASEKNVHSKNGAIPRLKTWDQHSFLFKFWAFP